MRWILLFALTACGANARPAPFRSTASDAPGLTPHRAAPGSEQRCAPLVAACGCGGDTCVVGARAATGWTVRGAIIPGVPHPAQLEQYCVGDVCTDVFRAELPCLSVCTRKAATSTCHFDADGACVSGD